MKDLIRLSKFLAVLLRHQPEKFGLSLDAQGYTKTDGVWEQINKRYPGKYTYNDFLKVVAGDQDGKKRYEINGQYIRALFGHSIEQPITYPRAVPPEKLYHGTADLALDSIRIEGLKSLSRQYVHLAINIDRAQNVAQRHIGTTVILTIRAGDAHRAGIPFYNPEPEHFLADAIPPEYIEFPEAQAL